ncbi:hypothetical protein EDC01DRAFT_626541 [Geopyxis carbonaria]|nr:hypothetical protein EDC01DRAFT_626541 [Geopyxis carbonaria]
MPSPTFDLPALEALTRLLSNARNLKSYRDPANVSSNLRHLSVLADALCKAFPLTTTRHSLSALRPLLATLHSHAATVRLAANSVPAASNVHLAGILRAFEEQLDEADSAAEAAESRLRRLRMITETARILRRRLSAPGITSLELRELMKMYNVCVQGGRRLIVEWADKARGAEMQRCLDVLKKTRAAFVERERMIEEGEGALKKAWRRVLWRLWSRGETKMGSLRRRGI